MAVPSTSKMTYLLNENVEDKLQEFVSSFVKEIEGMLRAFYSILRGEVDEETAKKFSSLVPPQQAGKVGGSMVGGLIGFFIGVAGVGSSIGGIGGEKVGKWLSEQQNLDAFRKLYLVFESFNKNETKFRQDLVNTAVDIFLSYEKQFMNITTDLGPEKAMHLVAKDAANRALNYFKDNTFTPDKLPNSIIYGKSEKVWGSSLIMRGFEIKSFFNESEENWKTASLYEKVGIIKKDSLSNTAEYYVKVNGKSKPGKYGFRRLLTSESWDNVKDYYCSYNIPDKEKPVEYQYDLTIEKIDQRKKTILDYVNSKDPALSEQRVKDMINEGMRDILVQIQKIAFDNNEMFSTFITQRYCEMANHCIQMQQIQQMHPNQITNMQEMNEIEGMVEDKKIKSKRKSVWFDVKDPTHLFTGRMEELKELHSMIHRNSDRVTVISQTTSICGLGGIGKTELARKYAHDHYGYYDIIVWINAENKENVSKSFTRLARDELQISTTNIDGGKKDIKTIVVDVYKYVCEEKSLFIFDNVETSQEIREFLPHSLPPKLNKPYILITSRNREWDKGIEVKNLNELKLEDAIALVRKGLDIDDESQEKQIKKLVERLQNFPLALQQAIAYIIDQQRMQKYAIEDYLEEYESQTRDLLDSEVFKGIDNDYSRTTFTTWKISTDKIASDVKHGRIALNILENIAFFDPDHINRKIFLSVAQDNDRMLKEAVRLLVKFSLLSGNQDQSVLSVHRLVQETTRIKLRDESRIKKSVDDVIILLGKQLFEPDTSEPTDTPGESMGNLIHFVTALQHGGKRWETAKLLYGNLFGGTSIESFIKTFWSGDGFLPMNTVFQSFASLSNNESQENLLEVANSANLHLPGVSGSLSKDT